MALWRLSQLSMVTAAITSDDLMQQATTSVPYITAENPIQHLYPDALTDGGYNNFFIANTASLASGVNGIIDGSAEITIDLGEPKRFATIFINTFCYS